MFWLKEEPAPPPERRSLSGTVQRIGLSISLVAVKGAANGVVLFTDSSRIHRVRFESEALLDQWALSKEGDEIEMTVELVSFGYRKGNNLVAFSNKTLDAIRMSAANPESA